MTSDAIWAAEALRFYAFVVASLLGSKALVWATGEDGWLRWVCRGFAIWGVATVVGYL